MGSGAAREDPGNPAFQGDIVDQIANLKVVRAVENQIDIVSELPDIRKVSILHKRFDFDFRIHLAQPIRGTDGFGKMVFDILFREQNLSLQVAEFDEVAVNDAQKPDTRASHCIRGDTAQRTASDEKHTSGGYCRLTCRTNATDKDLLLVT